MLSMYRVGSCGVGRVIDMWSELRSTTRALALPFVLPLILTWRSQLQSSLSNFRVPLYYTSHGGSAATRWKFSLKGVTTQISPAGSSSNPLPHFSEQPAALPRAQSEYHAFKKSVLPTEDGMSMTTFYYYILCKSFTVVWSDYKFIECFVVFFHPHLRIKSKTSAYIYSRVASIVAHHDELLTQWRYI